MMTTHGEIQYVELGQSCLLQGRKYPIKKEIASEASGKVSMNAETELPRY